MVSAVREDTSEKQIRELIDRWAAASRKGDIEGIMRCYTPDVLAFDAIGALQFKGTEAYRRHWETCISSLQGGEMILEVHELGVDACGGVAFAHYLSRCGGQDIQGNQHIGWVRATVCCRRVGENWLIAHEHYSMPFDPETNGPVGDLVP